MSFARLHAGGGYGSELEDVERSRAAAASASAASAGGGSTAAATGSAGRTAPHAAAVLPSREARIELADKPRRVEYGIGVARGLTAYERHSRYINDYVRHYGGPAAVAALGRPTVQYKTDHDVLREHYRFIREESDDVDPESGESSWEQRLAKRYYDKLFREYCLADMTYYQQGKIGLRWRTQAEVFSGKGQFICGNKRCSERNNLNSYEVNFAYAEAGQKKNALVKLRCCPACADMLNYKHNQRLERTRLKKEKRQERRRLKKEAKRRRSGRTSSSGSSSDSSSTSSDDDDGSEASADETRPAGDKAQEKGGAAEAGSRKKRRRQRKKEQAAADEAAEATSSEAQPQQQPSAQQQLEAETTARKSAESDIWSKRPEIDRTKEDEYEEFFEGLFM